MRHVAMILATTTLLAGCDMIRGFLPKGDEPLTPPAAEAPIPPPELAPASLEGVLTVVGPDGDWRVAISPDGGIVLDNRDTGEILTAAYSAPTAQADGTVRLGPDTLAVVVSAGPCASGVPGVAYPFSATVSPEGGAALSGCLYRPWTTQIAALAPAIQACFAAAPSATAVSYAESRQGGATFVRLVDEVGVRNDCIAGAGEPSLTPSGQDAYPGEADALFYPAPGDNPGGECYVAPQVLAADGSLLGWLADPEGC